MGPIRRLAVLRAVSVGGVVALLALAGAGGQDARRGEAGFEIFITVNTEVDEDTHPINNGFCSLREAIVATNTNVAHGGCGTGSGTATDNIHFNIGSDTPVINISSPLPPITDDTRINGNTGGATRVELRGPGGTFPPDGFRVIADGSVVANLVLNGFATAIIVESIADNTVIRGNFIGTDASGTAAAGGLTGIGLQGTNSVIGGINGWAPGSSCSGDCNLISGNTDEGIGTGSSAGDLRVLGNMIGTDVSGTTAIPNGDGVVISGAPGTYHLGELGLSGNQFTPEGNLISGNDGCATRTFSSYGFIHANFVGTDTTGTSVLPNDCGLLIQNAPNMPDASLVGGEVPEARNILADKPGLQVTQSEHVSVNGNYVGVAADGVTPLIGDSATGTGIVVDGSTNVTVGISQLGPNVVANRDLGVLVTTLNGPAIQNSVAINSIYDNVTKGISLFTFPADPPANGGILPPVITGTDPLRGTTCPDCIVRVYSDDADQGRTYEGSVVADAAGDWTFNLPVDGPNVTAIADEFTKGTSEFSAPFDITPATPTPSPSPSPTPSPTPTLSPTPTVSATPTAAPALVHGDVNCDGEIDAEDELLLLLFAAGLDDGNQPPPCPDLDGIPPGSDFPWGDINCDGNVDAIDALFLIAFRAGFELEPADSDCTPVGSGIS